MNMQSSKKMDAKQKWHNHITSHHIMYSHQYLWGVNWSDSRSEVSSEELAEVAVLGEVLDGGFLQTTAKHPDVQTQRRVTQPHRQHELVELTPQPWDQLEGHLAVQSYLSTQQPAPWFKAQQTDQSFSAAFISRVIRLQGLSLSHFLSTAGMRRMIPTKLGMMIEEVCAIFAVRCYA